MFLLITVVRLPNPINTGTVPNPKAVNDKKPVKKEPVPVPEI